MKIKKKTLNRIKAKTKALGRDAKKIEKKAQKKVKKAKKEADLVIGNIKKIAKEQISKVSDSAEKNLLRARDEFSGWEKKLQGYVKENPEKIFIAAAGIGAFVGAVTATLIGKTLQEKKSEKRGVAKKVKKFKKKK